MNAPSKRTYALGNDPYGRPIFLVDNAGRLTLIRHAHAMHHTEDRIELSQEAVRALQEVLASR